jgi:hypothetical protein
LPAPATRCRPARVPAATAGVRAARGVELQCRFCAAAVNAAMLSRSACEASPVAASTLGSATSGCGAAPPPHGVRHVIRHDVDRIVERPRSPRFPPRSRRPYRREERPLELTRADGKGLSLSAATSTAGSGAGPAWALARLGLGLGLRRHRHFAVLCDGFRGRRFGFRLDQRLVGARTKRRRPRPPDIDVDVNATSTSTSTKSAVLSGAADGGACACVSGASIASASTRRSVLRPSRARAHASRRPRGRRPAPAPRTRAAGPGGRRRFRRTERHERDRSVPSPRTLRDAPAQRHVVRSELTACIKTSTASCGRPTRSSASAASTDRRAAWSGEKWCSDAGRRHLGVGGRRRKLRTHQALGDAGLVVLLAPTLNQAVQVEVASA